MVYVGQPLAFIQQYDFVSAGIALSEITCLVSLLPSTLCGFQNTAFLQIFGSDKLE